MLDKTTELTGKSKFTNVDWWFDKLVDWGSSLLAAVLILVIGLFIVKRITKFIAKIIDKKGFDPSLSKFLVNLVSAVLKVLIVITAMGQLGIEMTSFVALIAAAGLAIGMAFSGTLGNLAGGVMILIFRPYKIGDFIQGQGEIGTVKEIGIFNTILLTTDNKTIIVPNGAMANGNMTNFNMQATRRIDFTIGIAYGDNYDTARAMLLKFIEEDERILKTPEPFIGLGALADSSVNITMRVWSKTEDYWAIFFKMNERIYKEFGNEGINFPFPQMDVHIQQN